jgi:type I restriction enzyme S subunit
MTAMQLLAHFNRISEAPGAIPRLRRFILELAVRGKLIEQDPHDEPASELIKRLQLERSQFAKKGKITKAQPRTIPAKAKLPHEIPDTWQWVPLGETLNNHCGGGTPPKDNPSYWDGNIHWASVKDIGKGKYIDRTIDRISEAGLAHSSSNLIPPGSLIVVTRMGLGKVSINRIPIAINQDLRALLLPSSASIDYHFIFFKTREFEGTGMTVKGIKVEDLLSMPFPMPPLNEQHRIAAKVNELMALCDRLEGTQAERESRRNLLAVASLKRLTKSTSEDVTAAREHARRYLQHLPQLTTRPEQVKQLRQTILDLAVRGALIVQDPNDEPASELLKRTAAQKASSRRPNAGRDWVGENTAPVNEPFAAPNGWTWSRIANTVERVTVGYVGPMKEKYVADGIPFLRSQNVRPNRLRKEGMISISPEFHSVIAKSALTPGDVVVVRSGNVGMACAIPPSLPEANCSDLVVVKKPTAVLSAYLCFYLNSFASVHIEAGSVGVALTHFNTKSVATMPLLLPPLAEQHRIVAKVDELMFLCDQLEIQLATNQTEARRLLEAVLYEALAAT